MNERIGLGKVRIFEMIGLIGLLMSKNLFSQGSLFPVKIDNKWGFIDKNGKMIVSPEFDAVGNYSESFIPVKIGGVWGFADENGKFNLNKAREVLTETFSDKSRNTNLFFDNYYKCSMFLFYLFYRLSFWVLK